MKKQKNGSSAAAGQPRKVMKLPLEELWNSEGTIEAERIQFLVKSKIPAFLKKKNIRLVLARLEYEPIWIEAPDQAEAWKRELRSHVCDKLEEGCSLDEFTGEYFFFASYWETPGKDPIILFEMYQ